MKPCSRRTFLALLTVGTAGAVVWRRVLRRPPGLRAFPRLNPPRPTPQQLAWQDLELGLFIHFGMATFTGDVDAVVAPDTFHPTQLDTDQWLDAAVALGARYAILTAKHVDGFPLWQSDAYPHGLRQSRWRRGKGDVVAEFIASCQKVGIKPGLYASTCDNKYWDIEYPGVVRDRNAERQKAYNAATETMLTELWSRYGQLVEIWFDSAVLPPERGGPDVTPLIEKYQPHAMVMKSRAATIRISGGETGMVDYPCWATARRRDAHGSGHPDGKYWLPAECNTPLRDHDWFWKKGREDRLHSLDELVRMYDRSVGRNANLLINANPDRHGLIPDADMKRYVEVGKEIRRRFGRPVAESRGEGDEIRLSLLNPARVRRVVLQEDIARGERIREYVVEARGSGDQWTPLCRGTCIGHKRVQQVAPTRTDLLRLRCPRSLGRPAIRRFAVYG